MYKKLDNLKWTPRRVSYLGCVKGCLDYIKIDMTDDWLYGATGHAFIMNISADACPSGPTAWNTEMLPHLGKNIGYHVDGLFSTKSSEDFVEKQKLAWDKTRAAIDDGYPCFGWELEIPEFYVVYGYDDIGYYFSGPQCTEGKGPQSWNRLGDTGIGVLEMFSVRPGQVSNDRKTVKEALAFALEFGSDSNRWIFNPYKAGLDGYDAWIASLKMGAANEIGLAYNAAVWCECREHAVRFLNEAGERIGGPAASYLFKAAEPYNQVAENLRIVAEMFPFSKMDVEYLSDKHRIEKVLAALQSAKEAESQGLELLQQVVDEL